MVIEIVGLIVVWLLTGILGAIQLNRYMNEAFGDNLYDPQWKPGLAVEGEDKWARSSR